MSLQVKQSEKSPPVTDDLVIEIGTKPKHMCGTCGYVTYGDSEPKVCTSCGQLSFPFTST